MGQKQWPAFVVFVMLAQKITLTAVIDLLL
jgi:hypothetical protein